MKAARFVSLGAALCLTLLAVPAAHADDDPHAQHGSNPNWLYARLGIRATTISTTKAVLASLLW